MESLIHENFRSGTDKMKHEDNLKKVSEAIMKKHKENLLKDKVKDCKNTNTIFDTRKYVLYEDVLNAMEQYAEPFKNEAEKYRKFINFWKTNLD